MLLNWVSNQPTNKIYHLKEIQTTTNLFIIKGFRTIVFIFIVISTMFRPICPPAFFRCLSNSGTSGNIFF